MALRGKKPEEVQERLKMFMFGEAGVGKTTAALQFEKAYVIDSERGAGNYAALMAERGSVLFQTTSMDDVIDEVRALLSEKHEFRTLIIDPITPLYAGIVDEAEQELARKDPTKDPTAYGRHYAHANKKMRRLIDLIFRLDMTVIVTSHAKPEYGDDMRKLGVIPDAWKKASYVFDLELHMYRQGKAVGAPRRAKVTKTRIAGFPDQDDFEWSYGEFVSRYGKDILEREAVAVELASAEQVAAITDLMTKVILPNDFEIKCWKKAKVDRWEDMPADAVAKCIEHVKGKLGDA